MCVKVTQGHPELHHHYHARGMHSPKIWREHSGETNSGLKHLCIIHVQQNTKPSSAEGFYLGNILESLMTK